MAAMRAEGGNDYVGRNGIMIGPYHQAFAELFYFLTTADYLGGCVRNNLKYISFEDCKLPPRGVGNVSLAKNQLTLKAWIIKNVNFYSDHGRQSLKIVTLSFFLSGILSLKI